MKRKMKAPMLESFKREERAHIKEALDAAGYEGEPTVENLTACFLDYVDAGTWRNLCLEDAKADIEDGEITVHHMCRALIKLGRN